DRGPHHLHVGRERTTTRNAKRVRHRPEAGADQHDAAGARGDQGAVTVRPAPLPEGAGGCWAVETAGGWPRAQLNPPSGTHRSRVVTPSGRSEPEDHAQRVEAVMHARRCRCVSHRRFVPLALSLLLLLAGCSSRATPPPDVVRPVKTMVVVAGEAPHTRFFPGKVEASKRVELAFQVPGVLVKVPVEEGQKVKAGEVIAQLRQDEFKARLKTLQGQLDQARAGLKALQAGERPEQRLRLEAQLRAAETK